MGTYWFYDSLLYIYALSLLFYFSDFVDSNRRAKRMGAGLLVFVWVLITGVVLYRIWAHMDMTLFSRFEYWLGVSWLLLTASLVISRFFRIEFIVFLVNLIAFSVLALNLFSDPSAEIPLAPWKLAQELLILHISLVLCAFSLLAISAVFAGMYLFLHGRLKTRRWSRGVARLPSLEQLDRFSYRLVLFGVPLLALSLSVAVVSVVVEGRLGYLLDWKVVSSFAALGLYAYDLFRRAVKRRPALQSARWNLICFAMLVLNTLINPASNFHRWS
ncbi:HemX protein, negative effector of steady-state concentration of glutamyl-tRNA reductase [Paenibacillus pasadenensis]|uniref:HemX protein, negative effector of steady-state concentration of glutamyl-tRNA reductase n=2 Tax=Paenibacillus pasadenensis TaxID=217090 RepID=A0A2N5N9I7_9BACL|nr:HemX protein, negative effector of steady-state concentration of glutamyl-tRNA reductase [Paenibacillus pasadenensis]